VAYARLRAPWVMGDVGWPRGPRLWEGRAKTYTLADKLLSWAPFGGSFFNHQWLVVRLRARFYPDAEQKNPAKPSIAAVEPWTAVHPEDLPAISTEVGEWDGISRSFVKATAISRPTSMP